MSKKIFLVHERKCSFGVEVWSHPRLQRWVNGHLIFISIWLLNNPSLVAVVLPVASDIRLSIGCCNDWCDWQLLIVGIG